MSASPELVAACERLAARFRSIDRERFLWFGVERNGPVLRCRSPRGGWTDAYLAYLEYELQEGLVFEAVRRSIEVDGLAWAVFGASGETLASAYVYRPGEKLDAHLDVFAVSPTVALIEAYLHALEDA